MTYKHWRDNFLQWAIVEKPDGNESIEHNDDIIPAWQVIAHYESYSAADRAFGLRCAARWR